jgi:hypothetical protein
MAHEWTGLQHAGLREGIQLQARRSDGSASVERTTDLVVLRGRDAA